MLVAFPTGRVEPGLERGVVVLGWSASIVLPLRGGACDRAAERLPGLPGQPAAGLGQRLGVDGRRGGDPCRLRRPARRPGRRADPALARLRQGAAARARPRVWTGAAVAVVGVVSVLPIALGADEVSEVVDAVLIVLITALPFAFLVGLMRSSLSRAGRRERAVRAARRRQRARRAGRGARRRLARARVLAARLAPLCRRPRAHGGAARARRRIAR